MSQLIRTLGPALDAWSATLLQFLWQGTVIALVVAAATRLQRRARDRHAVACAGLIAMLIIVSVTFVLELREARIESLAPPLTLEGAAIATVDAPVISSTTLWILVVWCLGSALTGARLTHSWFHSRRLRQGAEAAPPEWVRCAEQWRRRLGIRANVAIAQSRDVVVPLLIGVWRPLVILPVSALAGLPHSYVEAVLVHELAHVKRRDPWINALRTVAETLLFFHPAVWWLSGRIRIEREFCCDDLVVEAWGDPLRYARALTELEATRGDRPAFGLASDGGSLMNRIQRLVHGDAGDVAGPQPVGALGLATTLLIASLVVLPGLLAGMPAIAFEPRNAKVEIEWLPDRLDPYVPLMVEAGQRHGVDPELLAIMVLLESNGQPDVVSRMGAVGLMQVMPATAEKIARERGIDDHSVERLRDPAYNIDMGAWYLSRQLNHFGDEVGEDRAVELAAAAYNGGPKQLREHLRKGRPLSDETSHYQRMVTAMWNERDQPTSKTLEEFARRAR